MRRNTEMVNSKSIYEYRREVLEKLNIEYDIEDITNFERWREKVLEGLLAIKGLDRDTIESLIPDMVGDWLEAHPEITTTIQDGEVTTVKIADEAINSDKLADGSVTSDKIDDGSVTFSKLAHGVVKDVTPDYTNGKLNIQYSNGNEQEFEVIDGFARKKDYITPEMFGAKGDGIADDTGAILRCVSALNNGDTLVFNSKKIYSISNTIDIDKNINLFSLGEIVFKGTRNTPIMRLSNLNNRTILIRRLTDENPVVYHGYESNNYCALELVNTKHSRIDIGVINNTTVGIRLKAVGGLGSGFVNNVFNITSINNCKIGVEFYGDGEQSWINSNVFNSLWINYISDGAEQNVKNADVDRYGIKETFVNGCEFPHDSNIFNSIKIDLDSMSGGTFTGIYLSRAKAWTFNDYRIEITNSPDATFCNIDTQFNAVDSIMFYPNTEFRSIIYNNSINILNYGVGKKPLSSIYSVYGGINAKNSYMLVHELFSGKRKEYAENYTLIEGWFTLPDTNTNLFSDTNKESALVYTTITDSICPAVNNCTCYLYEPAQNSSYKISFNGKHNPKFTIRCYDEDGDLITTQSINTEKMYFSNGVYQISDPISEGTFDMEFSVVGNVKYIAITLSGRMSNFNIDGDYDCAILKTASGKYKADVLYALTTPSITTDFEKGDVLLGINNNGWILNGVGNSKNWSSI